MTFEKFTDEQWAAIQAVRDDWPDGIDWPEARRNIERTGGYFSTVRALRTQLGNPVWIRDSLRKLLQQTRDLQSALYALPIVFHGGSPDAGLAVLDIRLQSYLRNFEYLGGPAFRGRSDPYRVWLEDGLIETWRTDLHGDLSFARKPNNTPYGPLVEFLGLSLRAIVGKAPGPSGLAKIIDQNRKARRLADLKASA
jgi:hypothetical protein